MSDSKSPAISLPSPKELITSSPDIEASLGEEKGVSLIEVTWDGENDTENPMNWKASKKWRNVVVISIMSLST